MGGFDDDDDAVVFEANRFAMEKPPPAPGGLKAELFAPPYSSAPALRCSSCSSSEAWKNSSSICLSRVIQLLIARIAAIVTPLVTAFWEISTAKTKIGLWNDSRKIHIQQVDTYREK